MYFNRMYLERVPMASKKEIKEEYSKYKREYDKMYGGQAEGGSLIWKVWKWNWRLLKAGGEVVYETTAAFLALSKAAVDSIERENGVTRDQYGNRYNRYGKPSDSWGHEVDIWGNKVDEWGNIVDDWGNRVDHLGNRLDLFGNRLDGGGRKDFFSEYIEKMNGINLDKNKYFIEGLNNLSKGLKELKKDKNKIGITEKEGMEISKEIDNIVKNGRDIVNKVYKLMSRREYGVLTQEEFNEIRDDINEDKKVQKELERFL